MAIRLIAILVLSSFSWPVPGATDATAPSVQYGPVAVDGTLVQEAQLTAAVKLFESVGLELPTVRVNWSDNKADCSGANGVFRRSQEPPTIWICSRFDSTLVHELAHSWVEANLNDKRKAEYMELQGLESWNGRDTEWAERGTEDAANLIQLNLVANPSFMSAVWQDRAGAFELLTRVESPLLTSEKP